MRRDRDDRDDWGSLLALHFIWAVVPENPIRARGLILRIRLKNFLVLGPPHRRVFVGLKAGMSWIDLEVAERLAHRLINVRRRCVYGETS